MWKVSEGRPKNGQNSIWGKTGHLSICPQRKNKGKTKKNTKNNTKNNNTEKNTEKATKNNTKNNNTQKNTEKNTEKTTFSTLFHPFSTLFHPFSTSFPPLFHPFSSPFFDESPRRADPNESQLREHADGLSLRGRPTPSPQGVCIGGVRRAREGPRRPRRWEEGRAFRRPKSSAGVKHT